MEHHSNRDDFEVTLFAVIPLDPNLSEIVFARREQVDSQDIVTSHGLSAQALPPTLTVKANLEMRVPPSAS